jgi:ubiquinone/menaquinone biosynthesis C-methylase UbiE
MIETTHIKTVGFACPKCKHPLRSIDRALQCSECGRTYPIAGGIPDFLSGDTRASLAPIVEMARKMDLIAQTYEAPLWYSMLLNLSGAVHTSILSIANFHTGTLEGITGSILDAACGPGTYGRRIASSSRFVHGIDISMAMLRQGITYVMREGVTGIHFARARVEELPFEDAVFDGVICSGSLHLFPDIMLALREIARTMKTGAPLSVQTMISGSAARRPPFQDIHVLDVPALQRCLRQAGFEQFQPIMDGSSLTFSARKMWLADKIRMVPVHIT